MYFIFFFILLYIFFFYISFYFFLLFVSFIYFERVTNCVYAMLFMLRSLKCCLKTNMCSLDEFDTILHVQAVMPCRYPVKALKILENLQVPFGFVLRSNMTYVSLPGIPTTLNKCVHAV